MTTFFTDADLAGAGEFVEPEIWLAVEYTVPAGTASFRWRWPAVAPTVTPVIRVFDSGGTLVAGPISFDTTTLDAWNTAGVGSPVALSAGTYRVTVNTTRYPARSGFFSGGSITRGSITAVQGRFGSPGPAPATAWPAAYFVDVDFTASGGSTVNGAASPASTSSLTAAATLVRPGAATLGSTSAVAAAATLVRQGQAVLSSASALSASTASAVSGTAGLASTSVLAGAATRVARASANLPSVSSLSAANGSINQPGAFSTTEVAPTLTSSDRAARLTSSLWP